MIAPSDLPALRALIRLRRNAGWTIAGPYGERGFRQHVYREPHQPAWSGAKVVVEPDRLEYRRGVAHSHPGASFLLVHPDTIADVVGWLRLLGLIAERAIVADERSASPDAASTLSDRHMSEVGV